MAADWTPYIVEAPPRYALVRFWDEVSGAQWTEVPARMFPLLNVSYLWWKLCGIERMAMEENG